MRGLMDSWQDWKSRKPFVLIQESRSKIFSIQTPLGQEEKKNSRWGFSQLKASLFPTEWRWLRMRALLFICSLGESKRIPLSFLWQKDWADSQRHPWEKPISLRALEKCRGMKRDLEVNLEVGEFFFFFLSRGQGGVMGTVWPLALQTVVFYCF